MSLKGSLETVGLPDVLTLLAMTKKTGELQVSGARGDGRLWVNDGQLVGSSAGRGPSHLDALFELLRVKVGTFDFEDGELPPEPGPALEIEPLLSEATARLGQWDAIEASIPSLAYTVAMAPVAPEEEVIVRADQWRLLAAAGSGKQVSAVLDVMEFGEFDGCQALKELADANMITVVEPAAEVMPVVVFETVDEPVLEPVLEPRAPGEVDLSPIGQASDPGPIHSYSEAPDESHGFSDFGSLLSDAQAPSGIDADPFGAAFGEMVQAPGEQADESRQLDQGNEDAQGDQSDHAFVADQGYQPEHSIGADHGFEPDHSYDTSTGEQVPPAAGSPEAIGADEGHQSYPAAPSDQAPLGYQAGQGYQTSSDPDDAPTGGYHTYQNEHTDEAEPASFASLIVEHRPQAEPTPAGDSDGPPADDGLESPAAPAADAKATPADEPINRGLLLKFLSSVRT